MRIKKSGLTLLYVTAVATTCLLANPVAAQCQSDAAPQQAERLSEQKQNSEQKIQLNQNCENISLVQLSLLECAKYAPNLPVVVVVDQKAHHTYLLQNQNDQIVDILSVQNSTGKAKTPTPNGRAVITTKELNPCWTPPLQH